MFPLGNHGQTGYIPIKEVPNYVNIHKMFKVPNETQNYTRPNFFTEFDPGSKMSTFALLHSGS